MTDSVECLADGRRSWAGQVALAFCVFGGLGFAVAGLVFAHAPNWGWGCIVAAAATGFGGAIAWPLSCGRRSRPQWRRAVFAGGLTGILLHPFYWLIAGALSGEGLTPRQVVESSLFSLLVVGVITIPVGVLAGLCCQGVASMLCRYGAQQNPASERAVSPVSDEEPSAEDR